MIETSWTHPYRFVKKTVFRDAWTAPIFHISSLGGPT